MATMNFSVPDDVKAAFDEAFRGENKSAILTRLMRAAIEERRTHAQRAEAIAKLLELRSQQQPVSEEDVQRAREELRS